MKKTDPIAKFQFSYQHIVPTDIPYFTCIVPTSWLSKNLPEMGGAVSYTDRRDTGAVRTDYFVEFIHPVMEGNSPASISLDILRWNDEQERYSSCFEAPLEIHCGAATHSSVSIEGGVEAALLHHLFGHLALSATLHNIHLDMADIIATLSLSRKYEFALAVGEMPAEIMPKLQDRSGLRLEKSGSAFLMLFCNDNNIRLEYLSALSDAFEGGDSSYIYTDVAVEQDMMLISALIGHYGAAAKKRIYCAP
ncbi:MAG: hypothetical protein PXX77_03135 [Gallionella sp.]|nr:hypothetical protein [Gallionella sp.]